MLAFRTVGVRPSPTTLPAGLMRGEPRDDGMQSGDSGLGRPDDSADCELALSCLRASAWLDLGLALATGTFREPVPMDGTEPLRGGKAKGSLLAE